MEFDRTSVFLYSDEEGTPAIELDDKLDCRVMEERRTELLNLQESISLGKSRDLIGRTIEVLVEGISEETDRLVETRHEGLAPEIDGVVYQVAALPKRDGFLKVE